MMFLTLSLYALCWVFRFFDYFVLRTDQSVIGEAFFHKLLGIALFMLTLRALRWTWPETGFPRKKALQLTGYGLLLGVIVFALGYAGEFLFLRAQGHAPQFSLYLSGYGVMGNRAMGSGSLFLLVCLLGNMINVVMEEGVFRGLFVRLSCLKRSWVFSILVSAGLFGLWHIAQPLRSFVDGEIVLSSFLLQALVYIAMTFVIGIKYSLLAKMSGSLWLPMGEHFVNNTIINVLHVTSDAGTDVMVSARVGLAQGLSLIIVIILYALYRKRLKHADGSV